MPYRLLLAFATLCSSLLAAEVSQEYKVQVLDMGNQKETVSLTPPPSAKANTAWFVTDRAIDPLKFSSQMLAGSKRREKLPDGFKAVEVPSNLFEIYGAKEKSTTFWYYKSFIAPSNPRSTLAIRLGKISDSDEVFLNGVLIGRTGETAVGLHAWDKTRVYDIPATLLKPVEKNILLVKVESFFPLEYGIIKDRVEIGDSTQMNRSLVFEDVRQLVFLACYMTFGLYFLFLFLRRREESSYLKFFIFITVLVTYQFLQTQMKYSLSLSFISLKRAEYVMLLALFPSFFYYFRDFFRMGEVKFFRYVDYLVYVMVASNAALILYVLFVTDPVHWALYNEMIHLKYVMPVFLVLSLGIVVYQIFKRNTDARIIMVGLLCLVGTLVIDNLVYYGIINIPRVSSYVIFLFLLSLAFILANQFVRVHKEVENLNRTLEQKVEERTHELKESLKRVQDLKTQQDGDYFLTSLLIEPLSANRVVSDHTQVEFFVKEKKEFTFRRWRREIGGDMCVAHSILLRERRFTIALNADAMGKSMQGAGGALVIGSVFASIIERTHSDSEMKNLSPEAWLLRAFSELSRVFESFDGSMLVSIALAAVDDLAGIMYYINAEHPWTILYRNGKAGFIDDEFMLRKLGTLDANHSLQVKVFWLEDKDVVLMGSDGRDDLVIGFDEEGQRIINEDETLILRQTEKTGGALTPLVESLHTVGELSDDLSLIRIEYRAPQERVQPLRLAESKHVEKLRGDLKEKPRSMTAGEIDHFMQGLLDNAEEMHQAIRWLFQLKQYARGAEWAARFVEKYPMESEFLFLAGFGFKLAGDYAHALDFAERLFARTLQHEKNLVNLADLQLILLKVPNAKRTIEILQKHFPHNSRLERLIKALEKLETQEAVAG